MLEEFESRFKHAFELEKAKGVRDLRPILDRYPNNWRSRALFPWRHSRALEDIDCYFSLCTKKHLDCLLRCTFIPPTDFDFRSYVAERCRDAADAAGHWLVSRALVSDKMWLVDLCKTRHLEEIEHRRLRWELRGGCSARVHYDEAEEASIRAEWNELKAARRAEQRDPADVGSPVQTILGRNLRLLQQKCEIPIKELAREMAMGDDPNSIRGHLNCKKAPSPGKLEEYVGVFRARAANTKNESLKSLLESLTEQQLVEVDLSLFLSEV